MRPSQVVLYLVSFVITSALNYETGLNNDILTIINNLNYSVNPCQNFYRHVCPLNKEEDAKRSRRQQQEDLKDMASALVKRWAENEGLREKHEQYVLDFIKSIGLEWLYNLFHEHPLEEQIILILSYSLNIFNEFLPKYIEQLEDVTRTMTAQEIVNKLLLAKKWNAELINEIAAGIRSASWSQESHGSHSIGELLAFMMEMQDLNTEITLPGIMLNVSALRVIANDLIERVNNTKISDHLNDSMSFGSELLDKMVVEVQVKANFFMPLIRNISTAAISGPFGVNAASISYDHNTWFNYIMVTVPMIRQIFYKNSDQTSKILHFDLMGHELFHQFFTKLLPIVMEKVAESHQSCIERNAVRSCELFQEEECRSGERTYQEDTADVEGRRFNYRIFSKDRYRQDELLGDRFFFYTIAFSWCRDYERSQHRIYDSHSGAYIRVNSVFRLMNEFAGAFNCEAGDPMVAEESCEMFPTAAESSE